MDKDLPRVSRVGFYFVWFVLYLNKLMTRVCPLIHMPPFFIMTGEAVALIGAHTIGKVRVEFGPEEGAWVPGGDDTATPNGPTECLLFDFAL